ncbi:MAG TPA: SusC/RagA family TonB-linked outer membrane protein [Gemmatimonadales bacterium]|nr:SusC/RagA family TonB-linked outer membrane protein [Gemmatimonadales bacterium]
MSLSRLRFAIRHSLPAVAVLVGLTGWLPAAVRAQQGTVAGRVTDQASGQPLGGARVTVAGTSLITQTNADGRYTVSRVPIGQATVRANAVGFGAQSRTVTVNAGETTVVDLALTLAPYSLEEVVVTSTGDQAKKEVGNAITTIRADSLVATRPITNMNDLLVAKVAGVQLLPSPLTGGGGRVRIRGTTSLSLSNEPVYIIDGIRMESAVGSSSIGIGGTIPSRVNDINPEEIESFEVVRGPSASTLYGTDAANGVIVIKTKRGRPGPAQWSFYTEGGIIKDYNTWPTAYRGWRTGATGSTNSLPTNGVQCILTQTARAPTDPQFCRQDSVTAYNVFEDPDASALGTGYRGQVGVQVSGGAETARYFFAGEVSDERGLLRMPPAFYSKLTTARQISDVPYDQYRPNARKYSSLRANVNASLSPRLDAGISTAFITSTQRLPQTDNNTTGLLSNGFGGPGNKNNGRLGYRLYTPDQFFSETVNQDINRFIGSGTLDWRPTNWLTGRTVAGIDYTGRVDQDLCRRDQCAPIDSVAITGNKTDNRTFFFDYTLNADATATFQLNPTLVSKTTVGAQYFKSIFDRNGAFSYNLPPGATQVGAGAVQSTGSSRSEAKTVGAFVQQELAFRDRLFVTAALRADDNSAFGANYKAVYYPKASVSWVISDEPFFPRWSWINSVRVRGALGFSGNHPGSTDALKFYAPKPANVDNADAASLVDSAIGNPNLKPERAREIELGGEATLLASRLHVDFTYYNKRTKDALIARTVAPSVGSGNVTRFENLGAVVNRGVEFLVEGQLITKPSIGWDATVTGSYNTNFIADMGGVPPIIGTTMEERQGYPIDGYWQRAYTYSDLDGNGIITANEITVADSMTFVGYSQPRWEVAFTNGIDLFNRKVRIVGMFDLKAGHYLLNGTDRIRCQSRNNCRGLVDPSAPLWEQARVVALRESGTTTQFGFMEKADFIRLREASITYELPLQWARAMRASQASVTLAGRNLWKSTSYSGVDPESNYITNSASTGSVNDFQTQPPPTYWTFRLNVTF